GLLELYVKHERLGRIILNLQWEIDVGKNPGKASRQNADDRVILVIHLQSLADDISAAREMPLPKQIAEDRYRPCILPIRRVGRNKPTPEQRRNTEEARRVCGEENCPNVFG